jgi:hypothetical protein
MKSYLRFLPAGTLTICLFILCGCSKQNSSKSSPNALGSTSKGATALTPFGVLPKSHVHLVEPGFYLLLKNGHVWKASSATKNLVEDFGEISPATGGARPTVEPTGGHNFVTQPSTVWQTYAQWQNTSSTPISSFSTTYTVPAAPLGEDDESFFVFNALGQSLTTTTITPALQFGYSAAGGGQYNWGVANWYSWVSGSNVYAAFTAVQTVSPGNSLTGVIAYTGQQSNGSYNYTSTFTGFSNSLNVVDGDVYTGDVNGTQQNVTIPFVNNQVWAFLSLEAYNYDGYRDGFDVPFYNDFPASADIKLTDISLYTGSSPASVTWSPLTGTEAFWGENAVVVSNNSSGSGEVDLYYHSSGPEINGASGYYFYSGKQSGGGWIEATPGSLVTVEVTTGGPPFGGGTYGTTFYLDGGYTFTNGSTMLSCSGSPSSSNTAQFYMPSIGTVDWTGTFSESNSEGSGSVQVSN